MFFQNNRPEVSSLSIDDIIDRLNNLTEGLAEFWSDPSGWACDETAKHLMKSRLDRMVSFSYRLNDILRDVPSEEEEAHLILSWVTIGALTESLMMLFFSVFREDYIENNPRIKKGKIVEPQRLSFDQLKSLLQENELIDNDQYQWIEKIQQYRNGIHFFRDKKIGFREELLSDLRKLLSFYRFIDDHFPYPDEYYGPLEVKPL